MKKITLFTLSLICAMFVASCSDDASDSYDDATILISKEKIEYGKSGGSETFTVTVNQKNNFIAQWKNLTNWAEVSTSGDVVTVTVKPNITASNRTAEILVFTQNGGLKKYVDITQVATDIVFDATPTRVQFTRFGGEKEVRIKTNATDWTVEGGADWFRIEEDKSVGIIRLIATQNRLDNERAAVITVKSGTEIIFPIEVIQNGLAELILPYQNFGVLIGEIVGFEKNRGHIYQFTPGTIGSTESHGFMTNSYLMPKIEINYALNIYSGALVENSIPAENTEQISEFHKNYSALLVDNGYKEKTKIEYLLAVEDKEADVNATIYGNGVLFERAYKQTKPMPTFDKFPCEFMTWGVGVAEVDAYEASVGGVRDAQDESSLEYKPNVNDPDVLYRRYHFIGSDHADMDQVEIGIKGFSKIAHIGRDGKWRETNEFVALLEKENFKYLLRQTGGAVIFARPSSKGGLWITACAVRVWVDFNRAVLNIWDEQYDPAAVSSLSYIEEFKARVQDKIKRADKVSQYRVRDILK